MKKTIRDIMIAIAVVGIICFVFWQLGWITSAQEIRTLFVILGIVIPVELLGSWIWKKLF